MKKRKPTLRQQIRHWHAQWRVERRAHRETVLLHQQAIVRLQHQIDMFKRAEERRKHEQQANWADYDRCADAVTQHERMLFKASPAYQKYQRFRAGKENRETSNWSRLTSGDWRAP